MMAMQWTRVLLKGTWYTGTGCGPSQTTRLRPQDGICGRSMK
jgi:hypothetical protein